MERRRSGEQPTAATPVASIPHQFYRRATMAARVSWLLLLLWPPPFVGGCSSLGQLDVVTGRDMYAAVDLVASGYYSKETVVEQKLRANLSGDVVSKIVNSTFEVKDVFASNSSPPGYCFPPTIIIRTTVVDGCVDLLHLWLPNYSYVVAVRALDARAGYYEMREGYQLPFVQSSPAVVAQLRNVSCGYNQTCVAAHPSLCRAARLLPSPPPHDEQPITDAPPPTFAPTNDSDATAQPDGQDDSDDVTSATTVASPTASTLSLTTTTLRLTTIAHRSHVGASTSGGTAVSATRSAVPLAAGLASVALLAGATQRVRS